MGEDRGAGVQAHLVRGYAFVFCNVSGMIDDGLRIRPSVGRKSKLGLCLMAIKEVEVFFSVLCQSLCWIGGNVRYNEAYLGGRLMIVVRECLQVVLGFQGHS